MSCQTLQGESRGYPALANAACSTGVARESWRGLRLKGDARCAHGETKNSNAWEMLQLLALGWLSNPQIKID